MFCHCVHGQASLCRGTGRNEPGIAGDSDRVAGGAIALRIFDRPVDRPCHRLGRPNDRHPRPRAACLSLLPQPGGAEPHRSTRPAGPPDRQAALQFRPDLLDRPRDHLGDIDPCHLRDRRVLLSVPGGAGCAERYGD